ncbi:MAG: Gfo/Idh/MocA family oxidoreductase [Planctomycetota bacterium]
MTTRRIGLIDYDLNNFHANTYLQAFRGPLASRGYTVAGATGLLEQPCKAWAKENDVPYFPSVDDLASEVDVLAVLAPSNPETHLELCSQAFRHGKPTFVDKTFAPDTRAAERIFSLADEAGVAVQTTSALRTTNVQQQAASLEHPLRSMSVWAGGASFDEYGIHPVELVVSCLGPDAKRLLITGGVDYPTIVLEYTDDRTAAIHFNATEHVPFDAALTTQTETIHSAVDDSKLFVDAASAILDFFDAGQAIVPREETLAVMRILDAAKNPAARSAFVAL